MPEFLTFFLELVKSLSQKNEDGLSWPVLAVITLGMLFSMGFGGFRSL